MKGADQLLKLPKVAAPLASPEVKQRHQILKLVERKTSLHGNRVKFQPEELQLGGWPDRLFFLKCQPKLLSKSYHAINGLIDEHRRCAWGKKRQEIVQIVS